MKQHPFVPSGPQTAISMTHSVPEPQAAFQAIQWNDLYAMINPAHFDEIKDLIVQVFRNMAMDKKAIILENEQPIAQRSDPETVTVTTAKGIQFLPADDILYFVASSNYTWIHTATRGKHLVGKPIKHFELLLQSPGFFRIHNSYLVNIHRVCSCINGNTLMLQMEDGNQLEVSRRRTAAFRKTIKQSYAPIPGIQ